MNEVLATADSSGGGAAAVILLVLFTVVVLVVAGWWKMFEKAGEAGWKAIIPIWNTIVVLRIAGRPVWWFLLLLIPFVNFVVVILVMNDLAKSFGKSSLFTVGLVLLSPIFMIILGFGDARYLGPAGPEGATSQLPPPPPPTATA